VIDLISAVLILKGWLYNSVVSQIVKTVGFYEIIRIINGDLNLTDAARFDFGYPMIIGDTG
jgi:hypothetical protein